MEMENAGGLQAAGFKSTLSPEEIAKNKLAVDTYNKSLAVNGRQAQHELGKDDFLKLLITQLSNQDPTDPMDNTQFIAQMAQFSQLEQITNMNANFERLNSMLTSDQAVNVIGKNVEISLGDNAGVTSGVVEAVSCGPNPQVKIGNMYYDLKQIQAVYGN